MSKYNNYWDEKKQSSKKEPHPIWRGIGFLLLILVPIMSWSATLIILAENAKRRWVYFTADLLAPGADSLLYVKIGLTIFISLVLFALIYLAYFTIYRIFGPSRYGPQDVPMSNYKVKKYKR
jgi:hypothetical protein